MGEAGLTAKLRNDVAPTVKEVYCALAMHTVIVSLKKTYEERAKHVIYALWATRSAKTVLVVDDDIDPRNQEQVYWAIANRSHAPRDGRLEPPCRCHRRRWGCRIPAMR